MIELETKLLALSFDRSSFDRLSLDQLCHFTYFYLTYHKIPLFLFSVGQRNGFRMVGRIKVGQMKLSNDSRSKERAPFKLLSIMYADKSANINKEPSVVIALNEKNKI